MLTNFPNSYTDARETPSEGQERLIVEVDSDYNSNNDETPRVKVCLQKWANGIGWFSQKSFYLTLEQATFLKQEIEQTTANHKMKSSQSRPQPVTKQPEKVSNNPIPFPANRTARTSGEKSGQNPAAENGQVIPFRSRRV